MCTKLRLVQYEHIYKPQIQCCLNDGVVILKTLQMQRQKMCKYCFLLSLTHSHTMTPLDNPEKQAL